MDHLLELFLHETVVLPLLVLLVLHQHEVVGQHLVEELSQLKKVYQLRADAWKTALQ